MSYTPGTLITVVITKSSPDQSVGIGMGTKAGQTVVTSIKAGSPAASTELESGMIIRSINNIDCSQRQPGELAVMLAEASGTFPILAQFPGVEVCPLYYPLPEARSKKKWKPRKWKVRKWKMDFPVTCPS